MELERVAPSRSRESVDPRQYVQIKESKSGNVDRGAWRVHARCAEVDPELFFPDKGGSTAIAKSICRTCPVVDECLEYAMDNPDLMGIWGATSHMERRYPHRVPVQPTVVCPECGRSFQRTSTRHKYCTNQCRIDKDNRKQKEKYAKYE